MRCVVKSPPCGQHSFGGFGTAKATTTLVVSQTFLGDHFLSGTIWASFLLIARRPFCKVLEMKNKRSNIVPMRRPKKAYIRRPFGPENYLKYSLIVGLAAVIALLFIITPSVVETVEFDAGNVRVIDGDTIAVGRSSVRLRGVNAPERGQPLHDEGRAFLGRLLRSSVTVRCDLTDELTYGRRVGRCFLVYGNSTTTDIQRAVIAAGFATPDLGHGGWRYVPAMLFGF